LILDVTKRKVLSVSKLDIQLDSFFQQINVYTKGLQCINLFFTH
jgi:hypothetical protein